MKREQRPWPLPPLNWRVTHCAVRGCPNMRNNLKVNSAHGISFHRFPTNPNTNKQWLEFCDNEMLNQFSFDDTIRKLVMCSWHFKTTEISKYGRTRLSRNGLVPHLRPPRDRNVIEVLPGHESVQINDQVLDGQSTSNKCFLPVRPICHKKKPDVLCVTNIDALQNNKVLITAPSTGQNNVLILPTQPRLTLVGSTSANSTMPIEGIVSKESERRSSSSVASKKAVKPNSAIFCPDRKRLIKVHEVTKNREGTSDHSDTSFLGSSGNPAIQDSDTSNKASKGQDAPSSARVIFSVLGPTLTGSVPLETLISASTKKSSSTLNLKRSVNSITEKSEHVPTKKPKLSSNSEEDSGPDSELLDESAARDVKSLNPKLPGLAPFYPKQGHHSQFLMYLYSVTNAETWNVPNETILYFYKTCLDSALSALEASAEPNILGKKCAVVPKVRHLAYTMFQNGKIVTLGMDCSFPATEEGTATGAGANSAIAGNNPATTPHDSLPSLSDANPEKCQEKIEVSVTKRRPLLIPASRNIEQRKTLDLPGAGIYPILATTSSPTFLTQSNEPNVFAKRVPLDPQLFVMASGALKTAILADSAQNPPLSMHNLQAPGVSEVPVKQHVREKVSTLRIPASIITILKEKLPSLFGQDAQEGEFKVGKASFQQILGVLNELNYRVDRSGRVTLKSKTKAIRDLPSEGPSFTPHAKETDSEKKRKVIKGPVEKMHKEIVLLRRRNKYLTRQLEKSRNRPLTKQQKREATVETLKSVFSEEQFMFFMSQFTNATKAGSFGHRYEPKMYEFCASLYLESRRVYRKLRMMFHLPDHKSVLKNVADPQYFSFPKKLHKKAKTAGASISSSTASCCEPMEAKDTQSCNARTSMEEIAQETVQHQNSQDGSFLQDQYRKIEDLIESI